MLDPTNDPWFAPDIDPPYAVALFSARIGADAEARAALEAEVFRHAARSPGFLGAEHAGDTQEHVMAAIFWRDRPALDSWIDTLRALMPPADPRGERPRLYDHYVMRIMQVEAAQSGRCPALRDDS